MPRKVQVNYKRVYEVKDPETGRMVAAPRFLYERGGWFAFMKKKGNPKTLDSCVWDAATEKYYYEVQVEKTGESKHMAKVADPTVDVAWDEYIGNARQHRTLAPSTLRSYGTLENGKYARFVRPIIGHLKMSEVDAREIDKVTNAVEVYRTEKGKPLSYPSRKVIFDMVKGFFKNCLSGSTHYVDKNPCENAVRPAPREDEEHDRAVNADSIFDKETVVRMSQAVLDAVAKPRPGIRRDYDLRLAEVISTLFLVDADVGGRIGEMLALDLSRVEFDKDNRHLPRAVFIDVQVNSEGRISEPETLFVATKGSRGKIYRQTRRVALADFASRALGSFIDKSRREGYLPEVGGGLVFANPDHPDRPLRAETVQKRLKAASLAIGRVQRDLEGKPLLDEEGNQIPIPIKFHNLRHTTATTYFKMGMSREKVAARLGQSPKSATFHDFYHHYDNSHEDEEWRAAGWK